MAKMLTRRLTIAAITIFIICPGRGYAAAEQPAPATPASTPEVASGGATIPGFSRNQIRAYLSWALTRATEFPNDGHFEDVPTFDAGVDVDFLHAFGPMGRIGAGLRYAYGTGKNRYGGSRESEQWLFAPVLLGWSGGSPRSRVDLVLGLGLAGGAVTYGARTGKPYLYTFGFGAEASTSYTIALGQRLGLSLGLAARVLAVSVENGEPADYYMQNAGGLHGEVSARCGLSFDL